MSKYTMSDVQEADRLYDQMPMTDVASETGIPYPTLQGWHSKGLISTETNHQTKYDAQTIARVDELYDSMPLKDVAEVMDIPYETLRNWSADGLVNTDVNWSQRRNTQQKAAPARRVVELYFSTEKTQAEVGAQFGVQGSTVAKYVQQYRDGEL